MIEETLVTSPNQGHFQLYIRQLLLSETAVYRCSTKWVFLKIYQNFTCAGVSFCTLYLMTYVYC